MEKLLYVRNERRERERDLNDTYYPHEKRCSSPETHMPPTKGCVSCKSKPLWICKLLYTTPYLSPMYIILLYMC